MDDGAPSVRKMWGRVKEQLGFLRVGELPAEAVPRRKKSEIVSRRKKWEFVSRMKAVSCIAKKKREMRQNEPQSGGRMQPTAQAVGEVRNGKGQLRRSERNASS